MGSSLSGMISSAFDSLIRFRPYETAGQQGNTTVVAEMVSLIFNSNESDWNFGFQVDTQSDKIICACSLRVVINTVLISRAKNLKKYRLTAWK
jgi:hypothetical protein